ncbi:MAG: response regulator [Telmatospirillum sp.]|nr:response regulator [Telmatospirillum sp.]
MIHLANILIAADDPSLAQELLQKIRGHGYEGRAVTSLDGALATVEQEQPDIVFATWSLEGGSGIDLARRLRQVPWGAGIPICLAATERNPGAKLAAVEAGADDVLMPPIEEGKLVARLRPLVRLAIMRAELRQRARAAARFGVSVPADLPAAPMPTGYPILLVGDDGAPLAAMLSGAAPSFAADPFIADEMLGRSNFDAAILATGANPGPYLDFCAQARNNPRLFNLPVLLVAAPGVISEEDAYHHGASGLLTTPVDPAELQAAVTTQVRRQRTRWVIRERLAETLADADRDPETGVYSNAFLESYLEDRVRFSTTHGRCLSMMFVRVPDIEGVRVHFGEEQAHHLRRQVAQWITGLLRAEDLTARSGENEFCLVLPDTPRAEAEVVLHRIAGVLAYTDFAVKEVYQPVKIWARVGAADLLPEDTDKTLVARARANIL